MLIGYRRPFEDKSYNPLLRDVVVYRNKHGRAGFAPAFEGGKDLAAAMGGALPIFWDGTGTGVLVLDSVPTLSLFLPTPQTPLTEAKPLVASFGVTPPPPAPAPVVLPASMEAAIK
jgi:hypothetical protein